MVATRILFAGTLKVETVCKSNLDLAKAVSPCMDVAYTAVVEPIDRKDLH